MELIPIWCSSFSIFAKFQEELKNIPVQRYFWTVFMNLYCYLALHLLVSIVVVIFAKSVIKLTDTGAIQVYIIIIIIIFYILQACDFSEFFLISGFFTNLPLPQNFLERREVATKERKK